MVNDAELLDQIDRWREEGRQLRARLVQERDALVARVKEIELRLHALPADHGEKVTPSNEHLVALPRPRITNDKTVPEAVIEVLEQARRPMLAREIISELAARADDPHRFEPPIVHSALYRLKERKTVKSENDTPTGKQAFSLSRPEDQQ